MVTTPRPLRGVRVIDMTRFVSGAYTGSLLAALGADVIKVELAPGGDPYRNQGTAFVDDESALFGSLNVGKRSILVDPRSAEDFSSLESLLSTADVFLENGRPSALEKWGFDSASLTQRFPSLIYGSISGYGQTGPDSLRGGFDLILQAEAGLMSVTGEPTSGPVKVGVPILDIGSATSCALGIVAALYRRVNTGQGATVSSSLLEFAVATFTSIAPAYFVNGEVPGRLGSHSPTFAPYGAYKARDGHIVLAGAGSEELWLRLCRALEAPELAEDPRFRNNADRVTNLEDLIQELENRLGRQDSSYWIARLEELKVPVAEVRELDQLLESDQVKELGIVQTVGQSTPRVVGIPIQVDGTLPHLRPPPRLGEHSEEILAELSQGSK